MLISLSFWLYVAIIYSITVNSIKLIILARASSKYMCVYRIIVIGRVVEKTNLPGVSHVNCFGLLY